MQQHLSNDVKKSSNLKSRKLSEEKKSLQENCSVTFFESWNKATILTAVELIY